MSAERYMFNVYMEEYSNDLRNDGWTDNEAISFEARRRVCVDYPAFSRL